MWARRKGCPCATVIPICRGDAPFRGCAGGRTSVVAALWRALLGGDGGGGAWLREHISPSEGGESVVETARVCEPSEEWI